MRRFEQFLKYLAKPECGASARAIIYRLNDVIGVYTNHPADYYDFQRCLMLLNTFNAYRIELHNMADVSPEWALLVQNWNELELLCYGKHIDALNTKINQLFNGIPCEECQKPLNQTYWSINGKRYHPACAVIPI